ncbi:bifunctional adenosylcobinamide kinase/adenosylcobinamide-phosphate guanylyltransferase, partial [Streptomyces olivaceoviridis]
MAGRARPRGAGENRSVEVTLLGTGAPAGLPRPDCSCAVCATALGPHARA